MHVSVLWKQFPRVPASRNNSLVNLDLYLVQAVMNDQLGKGKHQIQNV